MAVVLAICLGGYAALLSAGRSGAYCAHSTSFFDTAPCYKTDITDQTADVLLVGDSALAYGVRPDLVEAQGMSVYNLGMIGPSFAFRPERLIDRYLAKNAKPRAIVVYMTAWALLSDDRIEDIQWAPLGIDTLRHGSFADLIALSLAHPAAPAELPALLFRSVGLDTAPAAARRTAMLEARGYLDYAGRGAPPLPTNCAPGRWPALPHGYARDNRAALARLRARYAARGIPLFVYIAPVAQCDGSIEAIRRAYAGVADASPIALPSENFADDTPHADHVHASAAGVPELSRRLARFIATVVRPRIGAPT